MRASNARWLPLLTLLGLGLAGFVGACATAPPANDDAVAAASPQQRWTPDHLIQQNQLLPNGLRPLRYFYW